MLARFTKCVLIPKKNSFGKKLKYHPPHAVNLVSIKAGDSPQRPISRIQIFPGDFISIYFWKGEGGVGGSAKLVEDTDKSASKDCVSQVYFFYIPKII